MQVEDLVLVVGCRERLSDDYIEWMKQIKATLFHNIGFSVIFIMMVYLKASEFEQRMGSEGRLKLFF